ncbi:protein BPS1, chloroplastic-like [Quillaja saponaria]|uniref:Protein BPS1, chloroplastic-like n=1 Tax=Quillaja saponaria TaxID=32244 RepID=A0AAD7L0A8_QUISA|nr:protein BPS1, chloroplastic-like [Quillaja saponaria]
MVLLIEKFAKLYSKLENHYHHHHQHDHHLFEELSASLEAFRSDISSFLNQVALSWKPGSEILSFSWIQQCFGVLPIVNKAFAKLVVGIDYPMSKWEAGSIEEYLNYSLSLLELFNSISSSLSHLGQARVSLSHGLSLVENSPSLETEHLRPIQPSDFCKNFGKEISKEDDKEMNFSDKELIVHQALKEMKEIGFWVCGIVLSGLCNNAQPYMNMIKMVGGFVNSSVIKLDTRISEAFIEKRVVSKEIKELNDAVACLVAAPVNGRSDAAKEFNTKLDMLEKQLEDLAKEVNHLFTKTLAERNELIDEAVTKRID